LALAPSHEERKRTDESPGLFGDCEPRQRSSERAKINSGVHILVIEPASGYEGEAPKHESFDSGAASGCGRKFAVEGVQFRLIKVNKLSRQLLKLGLSDNASNQSLFRNQLAHQFFGTAELQGYTDSPLPIGNRDSKFLRYGLLDTLNKEGVLTGCEVPLSVISFDAKGGIEFVDNWPVRRRLTQPPVSRGWPMHSGEERVSVAEAVFLQFQNQVRALKSTEEEDSGVFEGTLRDGEVGGLRNWLFGAGRTRNDWHSFFVTADASESPPTPITSTPFIGETQPLPDRDFGRSSHGPVTEAPQSDSVEPASSRFQFLPPAGFIEAPTLAVATNWLGDLDVNSRGSVDPGRIRRFLHDSFFDEPIDLAAKTKPPVGLYRLGGSRSPVWLFVREPIVNHGEVQIQLRSVLSVGSDDLANLINIASQAKVLVAATGDKGPVFSASFGSLKVDKEDKILLVFSASKIPAGSWNIAANIGALTGSASFALGGGEEKTMTVPLVLRNPQLGPSMFSVGSIR
ncbi:MAG: hypothetical protein AAF585_06950, partial [Verrucomicrobiota bacterium]